MMKKSILSIALLAGFIAACQTKTPEETADSIATMPDTTMTKGKTCYAYIKNKDTVSLSLIMIGSDVTGNLDYNYFEKDKNIGTIAGLIKGDTIIADYTFMSEGINSVRQVAFLKKGNQLIEGHGAFEDKNGKSVFKNTESLNFNDGTILSEIECK